MGRDIRVKLASSAGDWVIQLLEFSNVAGALARLAAYVEFGSVFLCD